MKFKVIWSLLCTEGLFKIIGVLHLTHSRPSTIRTDGGVLEITCSLYDDEEDALQMSFRNCLLGSILQVLVRGEPLQDAIAGRVSFR